MASYKSLTRSTLKGLAESKDMIKIFGRNTENGQLELVRETPKPMARAFSGVCAQKYRPVALVSLKDLRKPDYNTIVVEGASLQALSQILEWMIDCCRRQFVCPFPRHTVKPFTMAYLIRQAAYLLEISPLVSEMDTRLADLLDSSNIHSEDVRALYRATADREIHQVVTRKIAGQIRDRSLPAFNTYDTLCAETPLFGEDLSATLLEMGLYLEVVREDELKVKRIQENQVKAKRATAHRRPAAGAQMKPRGQKAHGHSEDERPKDLTVHSVLHLEAKHDRTGKKWVKPSLQDLSINRHDFYTRGDFERNFMRNKGRKMVKQGNVEAQMHIDHVGGLPDQDREHGDDDDDDNDDDGDGDTTRQEASGLRLVPGLDIETAEIKLQSARRRAQRQRRKEKKAREAGAVPGTDVTVGALPTVE